MDSSARRFSFVAFLLFAVSLLAACSKSDVPPGKARVAVVGKTLGNLVSRVAGDDADVRVVEGPGPDAESLADGARVAVMVGLGYDDWFEDVARKKGVAKLRLVKAGARVPTVPEVPGGDAQVPTVWLDPERARLVVKAVAEELSRADAAHATAYRDRATALDKELDALDKEVEARTAKWTQRSMVSATSSLAYFAERYHLDVAAVTQPKEGPAPAKERVLALARDKHVRALYTEKAGLGDATLASEAKLSWVTVSPVGAPYESVLRGIVEALEPYQR